MGGWALGKRVLDKRELNKRGLGKHVTGWIGLCILLTPLHVALGASDSKSSPVSVIAASVKQVDWHDEIHALGTTRANETVVITANVTEKIKAIHFEEGQQVAAGDLLVTLAQEAETAQLRSARAQLAEANLAYQRANELKKNRALSEATVQERYAALTRTEVQVDVIEAQLADLSITAPFAGTLGLRDISLGALVKPGDRVTTLDDLSAIKVDFDVPSRFFGRLRENLSVIGRVDAYPEQEFHGKVLAVNTQVDPVTRTVKVRALMPNLEGLLRPGFLMAVRVPDLARHALVIPEEALVKHGQQNSVFVIEPLATSESDQTPRTVEKREVLLGQRRQGFVEIRMGLAVDETVVVRGVSKIRSGDKVVIQAPMRLEEPAVSYLSRSLKTQGP